MSTRLRYCLAGAAAVLWLASFFLPAVRTGYHWQFGYDIAAAGFAGPVIGQFGWYANLIMIPALWLLAFGGMPDDRENIIALVVALCLLWLNTLFFDHLELDTGVQRILAHGVGYFAWMAALLIAWAGLLGLWWRRGPEPPETKSGGDHEDGVEREGEAVLEGRP